MKNNTDFLKIEQPADCTGFYELKTFDTLIVSFCADTPRGSTVEVEARIRLTDGRLTEWFSWGVWSPFADRHSKSSKGQLADLDTDTLTLHEGLLGCAVQIRVTENEAPDTARPLLRRVVLAAKNSRIVCEEPSAASNDVRVSAPCYSQMVRQPEISHVICSATTIAMLLNQKGENVLPEEIALHNYDSAYDGCGNWAFSTAIAASYGYDAYVRYATLDDLVEELRRGNAVGVSVSYTNKPEDDTLPYIDGAPCRTPGHLIALCGFQTASNGKQYAIVHDPAAPENDTVERFYPLEQFMEAWSNRVTYIVHKEEQVNRPRYIPEHVSAELRPAGNGLYALYTRNERVTLVHQNRFDCVAAQLVQRKGEKDADGVFSYGEITPEGWIRGLKPNVPAFVITNRGVIYDCK